MSGSKAKQLRRTIYGDASLRIKRTYTWANGGRVNTLDSLRAKYQEAKKA